MKDAAYLEVNPMGKVPSVVHDGKVVTECAAICAYLADAFPKPASRPMSADRADYYRWLFFTSGPVEFAVSNKALGFAVPPERERMMGYGNVDRALKTLETAISQADYLAGDSFTAVDLYVGSHLNFGMMFGTIDKRPAFRLPDTHARSLAYVVAQRETFRRKDDDGRAVLEPAELVALAERGIAGKHIRPAVLEVQRGIEAV